VRTGEPKSAEGFGAFFRYDLRTTDPDAAADFYGTVAGLKVAEGGGPPILMSGGSEVEHERIVGRVVSLPERARAAGAPAHWLGHVAVADPDGALRRLVELGGERLGPMGEDGEGRPFAAVRDPQGAVFALASTVPGENGAADSEHDPARDESSANDSSRETPEPEAPPPIMAWHQLHTTDLEAVWVFYSELFGWRRTHTLELGEGIGTYQLFAWDGVEGSTGAVAETARQPQVHTHWLFHFRVDDIDAAVEATRELGATVVHGPTKVPGGSRVAACDDPQGGAFGLREG